MQTYQLSHKIPSGLYVKQFLQKGGLPHYSGRVHLRQQRGVGLAGGNFLSKLIPVGFIAKKIGQSIIPKVIKAVPTQIGKKIVRKVGPKLLKSAAYNVRDVIEGKKSVKGALKDTVWGNRENIVKDALGVVNEAYSTPGGRKRKNLSRPRAKIKKRKKMKHFRGGSLMMNRESSSLVRGQKKKPNYMYGDVFDRLVK